jgi:GNAT superfamily N-acetyltransferase
MTEEYVIIKDNDHPVWQEVYKIAQEDRGHELWANYQKIDLKEYIAMIVYVRNGKPGAFHGVYNHGRWPDNVARIGNRAYISPEFRELGIGQKVAAKNIKFALDNFDMWGKDVLFLSKPMQYGDVETSWNKFQKYSRYFTRETGYKFECDDKIYQCCPAACKDCYQFCTWYDPKGIRSSLNIHSLSQQEWYNLD